MTVAPTDPAHRLPFRDPAFRADPYPTYARLRVTDPVVDLGDGSFALTRYEDCAALLRSTSVGVQEMDFGPADVLHGSALGLDAPDHTRVRRLSNKWFTPKLIREWVKTMQQVVGERLDALGAGELEATRELAVVPTHATLCRILGVSAQDADVIRQRTYDIGRGLGAGADDRDLEVTERGVQWYRAHIADLVASQRADPTDGMLAAFIAAEDRGDVTSEELVGSMLLFFAVGHLDVSYLICSGLHRMALEPDLLTTYRLDAGFRPGFINEVVRFDAPEQSATRLTAVDMEFSGTTVPAGSCVMALLGSANRDESVFPDPDRFDPTRPLEASQHLSFSAGLHSCAGQVLARAEADAVFTAISTRYSRIELAGGPTYGHTEFMRNYQTLPLRLI